MAPPQSIAMVFASAHHLATEQSMLPHPLGLAGVLGRRCYSSRPQADARQFCDSLPPRNAAFRSQDVSRGSGW